ncbi:MAG: ComEA family DNA-binding protein [Anaerolineae bacterium]|nr:ComEA family DNA-binding protein [Anaerolineae bacterium]
MEEQQQCEVAVVARPQIKPETQQWLDSLIKESPAAEEIERQTRVRLRRGWTAATVVSLLVGLLVGRYGWQSQGRGEGALTPPPEWGQVGVSYVPGTTFPTITPQPLRIYVSGAVTASQVVTLSSGSLLADALAVVGGTTADADLDALNLAAPLFDHQHIVVPRRASVSGNPASVMTPGSEVLVDLNTATAVELETLPHIGPAMAQRILEYREANGPFEKNEDLMNVSGIGASRYADIAPFITVTQPHIQE